MAVTQGSYDEFLNALRAQAPQPQTPTGGAIDLRNRLFSPTPVPAPAPPAPKPRADLMLPGYAAGTSDVAPAPDTSQLPWLQRAGLGINSFLTKMGQAQMQAADQEAAGNAAVLSAVGGGLSDLKAGLGGQTTPVMPVAAPAPVPPDVNPTPVASRAGPAIGVQGPYPAPAPAYTGFMDPRTHSLEDFVAANKDMTLRQATAMMKANPQAGAQGRIQQMLLGLAEAQHIREVQAAKNDPTALAVADKNQASRLIGIINPQGSLYYGAGQTPQ